MADNTVATHVDQLPRSRRKNRRKARPASHEQPRQQPRYHVVLWDDDDHTYEYVVRMLQQLFGHSFVRSWQMAREVDGQGCVICLTTTKEHAELKRDQILSFGPDQLIPRCKGSMTATIEPETA